MKPSEDLRLLLKNPLIGYLRPVIKTEGEAEL